MSDEEKYVLSNMVLVPVTGMRKKEFSSWVLSDTVKSVRIPVEKLIRTGWIIEINDPDNSIHLHPLISEVVLDELKPDEKACSAFLQKLKLIMEKTKEIHWGNPYLPFAMLIAKLFGKEIDSMQKAELLMCTANFLDSPHNAKLDSIIKSIEIKIRLFSFLVNHFKNSQEAYSCWASDFVTAIPAPCCTLICSPPSNTGGCITT